MPVPSRIGTPDSLQLLEKARTDTDAVLKELGSQLGGLSEAEAESRLKQVGTNEIAREKRQSALMWSNQCLCTPMNAWILVQEDLGGFVRPRSQFFKVLTQTPSCFASAD